MNEGTLDVVVAGVARFCDRQTLRNLACTCRRARALCMDEHSLRPHRLWWEADARFGEWLNEINPIEFYTPLCEMTLIGPARAGKTTLIDAYNALQRRVEAEEDAGDESPSAATSTPYTATEYPTRRTSTVSISHREFPLIVWGLPRCKQARTYDSRRPWTHKSQQTDTPASERFLELSEAYLLQSRVLVFVFVAAATPARHSSHNITLLEKQCAV